MRRLLERLILGVLIVSLSGCLGTMVRTPTESDRDTFQVTTTIHVIASPAVIDAEACRNGLAKVQTWVPLWGIAVGILTLGERLGS